MKLLDELILFIDHNSTLPGIIVDKGNRWVLKPFINEKKVSVTIHDRMIIACSRKQVITIFNTLNHETLVTMDDPFLDIEEDTILSEKIFERDHVKWIHLMLRQKVNIEDLLLYDPVKQEKDERKSDLVEVVYQVNDLRDRKTCIIS